MVEQLLKNRRLIGILSGYQGCYILVNGRMGVLEDISVGNDALDGNNFVFRLKGEPFYRNKDFLLVLRDQESATEYELQKSKIDSNRLLLKAKAIAYLRSRGIAMNVPKNYFIDASTLPVNPYQSLIDQTCDQIIQAHDTTN